MNKAIVTLWMIAAICAVATLYHMALIFVAQVMYYTGWHESRLHGNIERPEEARRLNLIPVYLYFYSLITNRKKNWYYAKLIWNGKKHNLDITHDRFTDRQLSRIRAKSVLAILLNRWREDKQNDVFLAELNVREIETGICFCGELINDHNGIQGCNAASPMTAISWEEITTTSRLLDIRVSISENSNL